jgi:serine/threonine protein kinase
MSARRSAFGVGGIVLGRYRLTSPLGAGAFASVWLAVDERLEREVAVKIIPKRRVIAARFEREVWAAARLSHPAIVTLYEAVAEDDAAYLVSELVRGLTLEEALVGGQLSDRDVVAVGVALCDALAYAHAEGIVHRDVKPSNVLVPSNPPSATPPAKLTDFGVAYAIGGDSLTATGDVVGTAAYMAPEQAAGRRAGPTSDLYSLALVVYEALTGVNPLANSTTTQRGTRLGIHLPPLRRQRRDLPRELGRGVDLALRPRPAERGTMLELREALELSLPAMTDAPGVVGAPWRPRLPGRVSDGQATATQRLPRGFTTATEAALDGRDRATHRWRVAPAALKRDSRSQASSAAHAPTHPPGSSAPGPLTRAAAVAAAAALTGWLAAHVLAPAPVAPAAAALASAAVMLALPRAGFALVAASLTLLVGIQGHAGEALVIAIGALVPIAVSPRGEPLWPLAGGAPLLGLVGLAGAWPAIAARADSARARAVLGLVGWVWLALASPMAAGGTYVSLPAGSPPLGVWSTSAYEAFHQVLGALLSSGALAVAPVWALAAVVLPTVVTRRSLLLDVGRVAVWAGVLVASTEAAISLAHFGLGRATLHGTVLGVIGAAVIALAPSAAAAWTRNRSGYLEAGLP